MNVGLLRNRRALIVLIGIAAAAFGGLYAAGVMGGDDKHMVKIAPEPVTLALPFTINLADTDQAAYIKLGIAVQLEPMTDEERELFKAGGAGGGHGGSDAVPGPDRVASYPKFRDAVIEEVSTFTSDELLSPAGKAKLKEALLARFEQIAQEDMLPKGADTTNHGPFEPPYHVQSVDYTDYAIQALAVVGG